MIEGDLTEISSDVVRKALCETIEQQLKSNKYKLVVSSASKAGENNFIGIIYRVIFGTDGNENGKNPNLQLILKVAPQNVVRRDQFFARPAFMREIYTYETVIKNFTAKRKHRNYHYYSHFQLNFSYISFQVLPILCQFEQSKGVDKERFIEYPKCYRTVDEEPNECLLFEDLSVRGFTVIDRRREEVTVDHVRLVMETLGKFHGISFAFKDQQPDKFNEIVSNLSEVFIRREDDHLRDFFNKQCEHVFNSVSREEDATVLAKAKKLYECDAFDVAADCLEMVGPATVISHGDAWQNNTMFRYDSSGKPIEICFLDWQTTRHTTPIIDIVYYMFCCTTKELRDAHYNELLEIYHDSLSAHIRRFVY